MYIALFIFLLNIPFGFWRSREEKFSFRWFLFIHLPVPIILAVRSILGVKLIFPLFVLFIFSYFLGQYVGAVINRKFIEKGKK